MLTGLSLLYSLNSHHYTQWSLSTVLYTHTCLSPLQSLVYLITIVTCLSHQYSLISLTTIVSGVSLLYSLISHHYTHSLVSHNYNHWSIPPILNHLSHQLTRLFNYQSLYRSTISHNYILVSHHLLLQHNWHFLEPPLTS